MGSYAQTFAEITDLFVGSRLKANRIDFYLQAGGENGLHLIDIGGNLRLLGYQRNVHIANPIIAAMGFGYRSPENVLGIHIFAGWIRVGEKMADIRQAQCSQDGIRKGMGQAVGI